MLPVRRVEPRLRILLALLALAANLIAAGVPLLHLAAHEGHDEPHHVELASGFAAIDHADHDHGAIHPAALHDEHAQSADALAAVEHAHDDHGAIHPASLHAEAAAVKNRGGSGFALVAAVDLPLLRITPHERRDLPVPVPRLSSRAPPPGDPARAPPLA